MGWRIEFYCPKTADIDAIPFWRARGSVFFGIDFCSIIMKNAPSSLGTFIDTERVKVLKVGHNSHNFEY